MLKVSEVNANEWRKELDDFEHSTFLSTDWVLAMENESSMAIFLDFVGAKQIVVGKLSGLICDMGWLKGKWFYCYASPALKQINQEAYKTCLDALKKYSFSKGFSRIVIGSYDQRWDLKCQVSGFYITSRYEYVVDLKRNGGESLFNQNLRRNVKKAILNNAHFSQETNANTLERLLILINKTREKRKNKYGADYDPFYLLNMNPASLKRFLCSDIVRIYSVFDDYRKHESIILNIEKGKRSFNLLAGSDNEAYQKGFPSFVDFKVMEMYQREGFAYYNLGGGTGDSGSAGLERSKAGKGGEKKNVYGATTNYLVFPGKLMNPLLLVGRSLPRNSTFVKFIKRLFLNN